MSLDCGGESTQTRTPHRKGPVWGSIQEPSQAEFLQDFIRSLQHICTSWHTSIVREEYLISEFDLACVIFGFSLSSMHCTQFNIFRYPRSLLVFHYIHLFRGLEYTVRWQNEAPGLILTLILLGSCPIIPVCFSHKPWIVTELLNTRYMLSITMTLLTHILYPHCHVEAVQTGVCWQKSRLHSFLTQHKHMCLSHLRPNHIKL